MAARSAQLVSIGPTATMTDRRDALVARLRDLDPELALEVAALARELDEASRLRAAFLQNLSHEVRTPITVMNGMLDILAEEASGQLDAEQQELITRARHSSRQVLALVEGVLDLSKAEVGMLEARRAKVFLPDLFTDLVRGIEEQLRQKGVRLIVDLPRGIDWVTVDGRLLQGLVAHLLSNAAKFTAEGEVRFTAALVGDSEAPSIPSGVRAPGPSGDTLEIVIEDTGVGIDPAIASRLSEPFRQADGSMTRRHEGLGIGLSVAHRMAEGLGAAMEIGGRLGIGTRVRVRVPLLRAEPPAPVAAPPAVSRVSPTLPLAPVSVLADLAALARFVPQRDAEAISFAIDFLDRQLRPETSLYASFSPEGEATITDLLGHAGHGLGPGMPIPLGQGTLARLATERRAIREERPGAARWLATAVTLAGDRPIGVLAARIGDGEASDDSAQLVQIVAGWLGSELGRIHFLRERAEWAATIGRDAKSPLGAALAHTQGLLRGVHGTLAAAQRPVVLELERTVHRVILSTLDLLDYQRLATRGFETERKPFALPAIIDHVLSRQSAAIELARASVTREIAPDAVLALGDLVRADRAVAVVVRNFLERLEDPRDIRFRLTREPAHARLEIDAPLREPASLITSLRAASAPVEFGEMLGPHVARAWIEAQEGTVDARTEGGRTTVVMRFPSAAEAAR